MTYNVLGGTLNLAQSIKSLATWRPPPVSFSDWRIGALLMRIFYVLLLRFHSKQAKTLRLHLLRFLGVRCLDSLQGRRSLTLWNALNWSNEVLETLPRNNILTYKVLHDTAPRYLGPLDRVADLHGRRALRSTIYSHLVVPTFRLSTVGSRTFNVSGPRIWNGLPEDVVLAPTLSSFRRRLKP